MIRIVIDVDRPAGQAIGIKESIAMMLEKYGDTRVVSVTELPDQEPEQIKIGDYHRKETKNGRNH